MTEEEKVVPQGEVEPKEEKVELPPDQLTKETPPSDKKMTKPKDPKKVAAGKALARKNKEAREAKKKLDEQSETRGGGGFFDSISIGTVVGVGGLLLGGANLYLRWREDASRDEAEASTRTRSVVEDPVGTPVKESEERREGPKEPEKAKSNEMMGME